MDNNDHTTTEEAPDQAKPMSSTQKAVYPPSISGSPETGAPAQDTPKTALPSIEFIPFIDEAEEKKKFWKTVFITVLVFTAISSLIIGYVLTQRLSQPSPAQIDVQYLDSAPPVSITLNVTLRPPRTQRTSPTTVPLNKIAKANRTPTPSIGGNIPYVTVSGGTPVLTPISVSTPAATRTPTTNPAASAYPTVTPTSANAPTPYLYATTDGTSGVVFPYTAPGGSVGAIIQLMNLGGSSLAISELSFAVTGGANPYTVSAGGDGTCLVFAATPTPYNLAAGASKCVSIHYKPTTSTSSSNSLLVRWNTASIKSITLSAVSATSTPTPTP